MTSGKRPKRNTAVMEVRPDERIRHHRCRSWLRCHENRAFFLSHRLVAHEHEPYTLNNVLEYGGKYYVVGSGRQPLQKDKTQTEDYYLLTLAAIAKELEYRNAGTVADVHLAAGLPLTSFGRDKKAFRDYLCRDGKPVSFRFEGQDYVITISKVSLYPRATPRC